LITEHDERVALLNVAVAWQVWRDGVIAVRVGEVELIVRRWRHR
jgi:hypothetical protein